MKETNVVKAEFKLKRVKIYGIFWHLKFEKTSKIVSMIGSTLYLSFTAQRVFLSANGSLFSHALGPDFVVGGIVS